MRVVSLLPAATELCAALGVEPVGVSDECDSPPSVAALPTVVRSRVDDGESSAAISEQVARAREGDGLYELRTDRLAALDPDVVITQGVCEVCAVDRPRLEDAIERTGIDATILTIDIHTIEDLYVAIDHLGAHLDRASRAGELVDTLRQRVASIERRCHPIDDRPRVAVLDWLEPPMVAGHWIPELVELAGGRYGLAERGARSRPREPATIRDFDPTVLVVAPCGFDLDHTVATWNDLDGQSAVADLGTAADRRYALDGNRYVNRPGPGLVDTLEYLAGLLHPDRFEKPPAHVATRLGEPVQRH